MNNDSNKPKTMKSLIKSNLTDIKEVIVDKLSDCIMLVDVSQSGNIKLVLNMEHDDVDTDLVDEFKSEIEYIDGLTAMYQSNLEKVRGEMLPKTYESDNGTTELKPNIIVKPVFEFDLDDSLSKLDDLDTIRFKSIVVCL